VGGWVWVWVWVGEWVVGCVGVFVCVFECDVRVYVCMCKEHADALIALRMQQVRHCKQVVMRKHMLTCADEC
jgi:hypothetical protein